MKKLKKVLSFILIVCMLCSMAGVAISEEGDAALAQTSEEREERKPEPKEERPEAEVKESSEGKKEDTSSTDTSSGDADAPSGEGVKTDAPDDTAQTVDPGEDDRAEAWEGTAEVDETETPSGEDDGEIPTADDGTETPEDGGEGETHSADVEGEASDGEEGSEPAEEGGEDDIVDFPVEEEVEEIETTEEEEPGDVELQEGLEVEPTLEEMLDDVLYAPGLDDFEIIVDDRVYNGEAYDLIDAITIVCLRPGDYSNITKTGSYLKTDAGTYSVKFDLYYYYEPEHRDGHEVITETVSIAPATIGASAVPGVHYAATASDAPSEYVSLSCGGFSSITLKEAVDMQWSSDRRPSVDGSGDYAIVVKSKSDNFVIEGAAKGSKVVDVSFSLLPLSISHTDKQLTYRGSAYAPSDFFEKTGVVGEDGGEYPQFDSAILATADVELKDAGNFTVSLGLDASKLPDDWNIFYSIEAAGVDVTILPEDVNFTANVVESVEYDNKPLTLTDIVSGTIGLADANTGTPIGEAQHYKVSMINSAEETVESISGPGTYRVHIEPDASGEGEAYWKNYKAAPFDQTFVVTDPVIDLEMILNIKTAEYTVGMTAESFLQDGQIVFVPSKGGEFSLPADYVDLTLRNDSGTVETIEPGVYTLEAAVKESMMGALAQYVKSNCGGALGNITGNGADVKCIFTAAVTYGGPTGQYARLDGPDFVKELVVADTSAAVAKKIRSLFSVEIKNGDEVISDITKAYAGEYDLVFSAKTGDIYMPDTTALEGLKYTILPHSAEIVYSDRPIIYDGRAHFASELVFATFRDTTDVGRDVSIESDDVIAATICTFTGNEGATRTNVGAYDISFEIPKESFESGDLAYFSPETVSISPAVLESKITPREAELIITPRTGATYSPDLRVTDLVESVTLKADDTAVPDLVYGTDYTLTLKLDGEIHEGEIVSDDYTIVAEAKAGAALQNFTLKSEIAVAEVSVDKMPASIEFGVRDYVFDPIHLKHAYSFFSDYNVAASTTVSATLTPEVGDPITLTSEKSSNSFTALLIEGTEVVSVVMSVGTYDIILCVTPDISCRYDIPTEQLTKKVKIVPERYALIAIGEDRYFINDTLDVKDFFDKVVIRDYEKATNRDTAVEADIVKIALGDYDDKIKADDIKGQVGEYELTVTLDRAVTFDGVDLGDKAVSELVDAAAVDEHRLRKARQPVQYVRHAVDDELFHVAFGHVVLLDGDGGKAIGHPHFCSRQHGAAQAARRTDEDIVRIGDEHAHVHDRQGAARGGAELQSGVKRRRKSRVTDRHAGRSSRLSDARQHGVTPQSSMIFFARRRYSFAMSLSGKASITV